MKKAHRLRLGIINLSINQMPFSHWRDCILRGLYKALLSHSLNSGKRRWNLTKPVILFNYHSQNPSQSSEVDRFHIARNRAILLILITIHDSCISGDIYRHCRPKFTDVSWIRDKNATCIGPIKLLLNRYIATESLRAAPKFVLSNPQKSLATCLLLKKTSCCAQVKLYSPT